MNIFVTSIQMMLRKEDIELDLIELESAGKLVLEEESADSNLNEVASDMSKIKISEDKEVEEDEDEGSRYVNTL